MVKRELNRTHLSLSQVCNAIYAIATYHPRDFKLEKQDGLSIRILCRTGYSWGTIADFLFDNEGQHPVTLECKPNPASPPTSQIQKEYEEKYIDQLSQLYNKYITNTPQPRKKPKGFAGMLNRLSIMLGFVNY